VRVDSLRNVYFSDAGNAVIRKINTSGIITTIAGSNIGGYSGDSGKATSAKINYPVGICLDKYLNLYIADQSNHVIRKVTASTGIINTVAGCNLQGNAGNGGPAVKAKLNSPTGVAVDNSGNIYIADFKNNEIRMVNTSGIISVYAGTGVAGSNGGSGLPKVSQLNNPAGVATDSKGNVFIADAGNGVVREVLASIGRMSIIAGIGADGFKGDGGPAVNAQISYPFDITCAKNGDLYIADLGNNRVRMITAASPDAPAAPAHTPTH
jgi:sugar lactone lactonase YvrE